MSYAARGSVRISALLVCVAAILMVSSIAVGPLGKGKAAGDQGTTLVRGDPPMPPWAVQGYVTESDGVTPLVSGVVTVTNTATGAWNLTGVDEFGYGWYEFNMRFFASGAPAVGDLINVTVTNGTDIGWVEGLVVDGPLNMDVVLHPGTGPPPSSWTVQGYVYESDGVTPVVSCVVNVTNKNTGAWNLTGVDGSGWYQFNMTWFDGGVTLGDTINITVTRGADIGWVEGIVPSGPLNMDVVMGQGALIPEFPLVVVPVLGLMALFVVVSLKRREDGAQ
jgi:hypothetical protein